MPRLTSLISIAALLGAVSISPLPADAQASAADSVRAFDALPESLQVLALNRQAWALRRSEPALAIAISRRSLDLARRIGFRAGEAQVLNYLGVGYQWLGDNRKASNHFFSALSVAEAAGSVLEQGYALNNIAALLLAEKDGVQALTYAERALALQETSGDVRGLAYAHIRLAEIHNFLGRYDDALTHARTSLRIWRQVGETSTSFTALRNVAVAYEGKRQYAPALAHLLAIDASDSLPATTRQHNYTDLARIYLRAGQPARAIEFGLKRLQSTERDVEILGHLAEAYAQQRDWANAYAFARREAAVRDSVATEAGFRQLKGLQIDYETAKTEQENAALREGLRLTRWLTVAIGAILLLAGAFVVSLFRGRRRQEAVNRTLAEQLARIQASEEALAESWQRQRAILENVRDAMWVKEIGGRYTTVNAAFCRRFGRTREELEGRTAAEFLGDDAVAMLAEHEQRVLATRETIREEQEIVVGAVSMLVERTISPVFDADGAVVGTTGISRDVTDRRRAEVQLRQAQKLESLGVLAGGIAHDFNNLLAGILGNTELARYDVAPDSPAGESLAQIEVSARRATELTRQMLDYTGQTQSDLRALDLSAIVRAVTPEIERAIPRSATLRFDLSTALPRVSADASQVAQVLLGLVTNAGEALPDGQGTITVRTEVARIEARGATAPLERHLHEAHHALVEGEYVAIEVSDTGHGMTAETRRRIFDPFFSTRFVGRGLSLAAVLGILRRHGGTIEVESVVDRGSRFRAYFPVVRPPADRPVAVEAPVAVPVEAPVEAPRGVPREIPRAEPVPGAVTPAAVAAPEPQPAAAPRETILVVDDDATVRTFARRVLERSGYAVVLAEDGVEGVASVQAQGAELAGVLLDVMMPRLGGREAAEEMRRMIPDLPIVIMSGYTGDTAVEALCAQEGVQFLAKPFRADVLAQALRTLIDARAGRGLVPA